jgi:hypothetical protein
MNFLHFYDFFLSELSSNSDPPKMTFCMNTLRRTHDGITRNQHCTSDKTTLCSPKNDFSKKFWNKRKMTLSLNFTHF